jgi:hypothetical protein
VNKKIGKFKLWQLVALGAAIGIAIYFYNRNKAPAVNPEEVVGGTGTGAFGPIDPNSGIPYAFEGGANSENANNGIQEALSLIEQAKGLASGEGSGGGETYTETVIQEPGEPTPLAQTKNHKPKSTGAAASNKHSHWAAAHPWKRLSAAQKQGMTLAQKRSAHRKENQAEKKRLRRPGAVGVGGGSKSGKASRAQRQKQKRRARR